MQALSVCLINDALVINLVKLFVGFCYNLLSKLVVADFKRLRYRVVLPCQRSARCEERVINVMRYCHLVEWVFSLLPHIVRYQTQSFIQIYRFWLFLLSFFDQSRVFLVTVMTELMRL